MYSIFIHIQNYGIFTHHGAYDEAEYHSLPADPQSQSPYLEGSPEFYSGMMDQKYVSHYHKTPYSSRGNYQRSAMINIVAHGHVH